MKSAIIVFALCLINTLVNCHEDNDNSLRSIDMASLIDSMNTVADSSACLGIPTGVFLIDYTACNRYIACVNGVGYHGECPSPYVFNVDTQACDWREKVNCFECPLTGFKRIASGGLCNRYIECIGGGATVKYCPDKLKFDPVSQECSTSSTCVNNPCPSVDTPGKPIYVESTEECGDYHVCIEGKLHDRSCPDGLFWNTVAELCDRPENVKCAFAPLVYCGDATFVPHPDDCNKYFICNNGRPTEFSCATGLCWDQSRQQCRRT